MQAKPGDPYHSGQSIGTQNGEGGRVSSEEFRQQHPNVELHFTPTYSSWLNQVEIWFARIEREVIARGIFSSVKDLARKLMRYIHAYSASAKPFFWKYTNANRRITC